MTHKPVGIPIWVGLLFTFGRTAAGLSIYSQYHLLHPVSARIGSGFICLLIGVNWVFNMESFKNAPGKRWESMAIKTAMETEIPVGKRGNHQIGSGT
jgi:hypothetical protein